MSVEWVERENIDEQVKQLRAMGLSYKEISVALNVSIGDVKCTTKRLLKAGEIEQSEFYLSTRKKNKEEINAEYLGRTNGRNGSSKEAKAAREKLRRDKRRTRYLQEHRAEQNLLFASNRRN